jgi:hypothetical protein
MHEAKPRRDATHLKRGGVVSPMTKTVALPLSPPAAMPLTATFHLCCGRSLRPYLDAGEQDPRLDVAPERDQ